MPGRWGGCKNFKIQLKIDQEITVSRILNGHLMVKISEMQHRINQKAKSQLLFLPKLKQRCLKAGLVFAKPDQAVQYKYSLGSLVTNELEHADQDPNKLDLIIIRGYCIKDYTWKRGNLGLVRDRFRGQNVITHT
jgi:hypothetical protein